MVIPLKKVSHFNVGLKLPNCPCFSKAADIMLVRLDQ